MLMHTYKCANNNPFAGVSCQNTVSADFFALDRIRLCSECEAKKKAAEVFARLAKLSEFTACT